MPIQTVQRTWTIATWLIAGHSGEIDVIDRAVEELGADAVLLQSVRETDTRQLAAGLGFNHVWARSHSPRSRLIRRSAVGLAVLTPHHITGTTDMAIGEHRSTWSQHRRIAQFAAVARSDHSGYEFLHSVGPLDPTTFEPRLNAAPLVRVHPARIDGDPSTAVELPDGATVRSLRTDRPIPGAAQLLFVTFDLPWVQGDFPTS